MSKQLKYQGQIIGIQQELSKVFKLQYVYEILATKLQSSAELTRNLKPFQKNEQNPGHCFRRDFS